MTHMPPMRAFSIRGRNILYFIRGVFREGFKIIKGICSFDPTLDPPVYVTYYILKIVINYIKISGAYHTAVTFLLFRSIYITMHVPNCKWVFVWVFMCIWKCVRWCFCVSVCVIVCGMVIIIVNREYWNIRPGLSTDKKYLLSHSSWVKEYSI